MKKDFYAIIAGAFFSCTGLAQSYDYLNPVSHRHTISIQVSPSFVAAGDRAVDAELCDASEKFVCVLSDQFNFAFPTLQRKPPQWEHRGIKYELVAEDRIRILGHAYHVWIVESLQGEKRLRYAYSEKQGLLAFSIQLPDVTSTFVSTKPTGFGNSNMYRRRTINRTGSALK